MSHVRQYSLGSENEIARQTASRASTAQVGRKARRTRILGNATLVFDNGRCSMDCIVLDVSESGAKIRPADLLTLPEQFEIKFKLMSKPPHPCEVVRRSANYLGVRYLRTTMETAQAF